MGTTHYEDGHAHLEEYWCLIGYLLLSVSLFWKFRPSDWRNWLTYVLIVPLILKLINWAKFKT